jgi:hypothetical protein
LQSYKERWLYRIAYYVCCEFNIYGYNPFNEVLKTKLL